jgi:hypothetical protein
MAVTGNTKHVDGCELEYEEEGRGQDRGEIPEIAHESIESFRVGDTCIGQLLSFWEVLLLVDVLEVICEGAVQVLVDAVDCAVTDLEKAVSFLDVIRLGLVGWAVD